MRVTVPGLGPIPPRPLRVPASPAEDLRPRGRVPRHLLDALGRFRPHPVTWGNRAVLYDRGRFAYAAMLAAIESARDHVNLETYGFAADRTGRRFAGALAERAAAGVVVNVIVDAVGSWDTPAAFFDDLRSRGVHVHEFSPVAPWRVRHGRWLPNRRDHRKILVVDGRTGFTGGMNIGDDYDDDGATPGRWRDVHLRIEGPAVRYLQRAILATLYRRAPDATREAHWFPPLEPCGDHGIRILPTTPVVGRPYVRISFRRAVAAARETVHATQAYFMPDARMLWSLGRAAARGVEVGLVVPGVSDVPLALHAGRSTYGRLLRRGVRIHERRDRVLHTKSVVVDGTWSILGSANMDIRSFRMNYEVSVDVLGADFGASVERVYAYDVSRSDALDAATWARRPLLRKIKERLCGLARHFV